jgi:hypothetical protein
MSPALANASVTIAVKAWSNVRGTRTATATSSTHRASVQPMKSFRREVHKLTQGQTGYTVYLTTDPACNAGDTVTWGTKTLTTLGPARDEAGRGRVWAVDCLEVA